MQSQGFKCNVEDPCLYIKIPRDGQLIMLKLYVDDMLIAGHSKKDIADIKQKLFNQFDMKDLGELWYFLGIEIVHTPKGIWLSQRQYALDVLSKYDMAALKPISMSLDQNLKLRAYEGQVIETVTMY